MNSSRSFYFFLLIVLTSFSAMTLTSCKDDDLPTGKVFLNHDDDNVDAPLLPSGTFQAGARFVPDDFVDVAGKNLEEVQFYLLGIPRTTLLRIYKGSNGDEPGTQVYEVNLTAGLDADSWNTHTLPTPIELTNEDLWITIRFTLDSDSRTLGCDPGPALANGDWLYDGADQTWTKLSDRGPVNINWNIRGVVNAE